MSPERTEVLGVGVDLVTEDDVLRAAANHLADRAQLRIVTVNAEYVMIARRRPDFADVIARADLATPDGMGVVWAMRLRGANQRARVGGSDLIWSLSRLAASRGESVFLLGAADGVAREAARRLQAHVPGLVIAGTFAGSPSAAEAGAIVQRIKRSGASILYVAFGAPGQDAWLDRHLEATGALIGIGVGGSFDYVAGRARRAPGWMRESGLDWLWRLIRQPWRWRRMLALPHFAYLVLVEGLRKGFVRE
ncbi:MAG TPA: WecB/TagA/CpsF family glycosyltransferase [Chloroflexota bacterium]|nr:WecB/TagA/CpsF family glycosyltransferase [Chloroflexota bacterium]